jgi:hypothetical protein
MQRSGPSAKISLLGVRAGFQRREKRGTRIQMSETMIIVTIQTDGSALVEENDARCTRSAQIPSEHRASVATAILGGISPEMIERAAPAFLRATGGAPCGLDAMRRRDLVTVMSAAFEIEPQELP